MAKFDQKDAAAHLDQSDPDSGFSFPAGSQLSSPKRRKFLQAFAGAATGLATATGTEFLAPSASSAQTLLTPEEALEELVAGNKRFVAEDLRSFKENLAILRNNTSEKQQPFAAVLACADSRVPVELIFDQSIGRIFVARVAGNVATSEIIASLEYGVQVLKVKVILVMGHGKCGAVEAAIDGGDVPGQISALYPHIQPAVDIAGPDVELTIKENAKIQASLLRKASTVISAFVRDHNLLVIPAFYHLGSGEVSLLPSS